MPVHTPMLCGRLQEPEPRLPGLLKMLLWAQQRLEERVEFPKCAPQDHDT